MLANRILQLLDARSENDYMGKMACLGLNSSNRLSQKVKPNKQLGRATVSNL